MQMTPIASIFNELAVDSNCQPEAKPTSVFLQRKTQFSFRAFHSTGKT